MPRVWSPAISDTAKLALGASTGGLGLIIGSEVEQKLDGDVCAAPQHWRGSASPRPPARPVARPRRPATEGAVAGQWRGQRAEEAVPMTGKAIASREAILDTATAEREADSFTIRLDGKPVHVPAAECALAHAPLAEAVADECNAPAAPRMARCLRRHAADAPCRHRAGPHRRRSLADGGRHRPLRRERPAVLPRRDARALVRASTMRGSPGWTGPRRAMRTLARDRRHRRHPQHRASIAALRTRWPPATSGPGRAGIAVPALGSLVLGLALAEQAIDPPSPMRWRLGRAVSGRAMG